jgi:DNA-binding NarL/FixJ family response regulator
MLGQMAIRVVLADDSLLTLEGLTAMLARAEGIEVVATAGSRGAARHEIDVHSPDVLVSDIRMPPTNVDEGITRQHGAGP